VVSYLWKKDKWENTDKEFAGSCYRGEKSICTEKEENVSVVKRGERGGMWVYQRTIEESIY